VGSAVSLTDQINWVALAIIYHPVRGSHCVHCHTQNLDFGDGDAYHLMVMDVPNAEFGKTDFWGASRVSDLPQHAILLSPIKRDDAGEISHR
jgi:hypothetical protein